MPNNISVKITADVADLTAKRAVASAELKALQKDLNDLARMSRDQDWAAALKGDLLAAGDAAAKAQSKVKVIDDQLRTLAPAAEAAHTGMSGITRELIVLGREAGRGNFSRMAGSATILAQRMGLLTTTVLATGAAIAAVTLPFIIFGAAVEAGSKELAHFQNAMEATNGYAGVTISQMQLLARAQASWAKEGVGAATKQLTELAASGRFTGETLQLIGRDAVRMSQLTAESADKWNTEFEKMGAGVAKFAAEYQAKYGQLTTAQFQYIQQLEDQGRKETAEYQLAKDIYEYLGTRAPQNLGLLESAWRGVANGIASAWDGLKAFGRDSNLDRIARLQLAIASQKQWGNGASPAVAAMEKQVGLLVAAEQASQKQAAAQAEATAKQKEGVAAASALHEKFEASKTSGEKLAKALKDINDELKKAVAADPNNRALYEKEAAAARSQALKSDTPHTHDDTVAQWAEQLHQQEILSNDFFGDQTTRELAFWQSKLALTQKGSKDWLEVQARIYEASKTLAHRNYDAQIADLDAQLEANRDNWGQELGLWDEKLATIGLNFGDQSKEYETAYKEFEAAERQHQQRMAQLAHEGAQERLAELQNDLKTQSEIRKADAAEAEAEIQARAKYSGNPLAEVAAAQQVAAIRNQLARQQLADLEATYAAENALRTQAEINALDDFGTESTQYQQASDAKKKADHAFYSEHAVLEDQMVNQSRDNALQAAQAWRSAMDPYFRSVSSGLSGLAKGTESVVQALANIGDTIIDKVIDSVVKWTEEQTVAYALNHAHAAADVATHAAAETAKTASTTAGVAARTGAESTGFFAKLLGFLGINLGTHTATEAAKTAATTAGAAARSTAEVAASTAAQATSKVLALSQIATDIALAGAGGVASMAAAPFPIDLGAPAFGAAMAAEAAAFGALGAFDKGIDIVPQDMVALIHQGEKIVPKADNAALMAAVRGGAGAGGNTFNLYHQPTVQNGQPMGLRQLLASEGGHLFDFLNRAVRDGKLKLQPA